MSTRCNVVIEVPHAEPIYLYRHYDGSPAITGADILRLFAGFRMYPHPTEVANRLVKSNDGKDFDLTSYFHGDIEHCYFVRIETDGIKISHVTGYEAAHHPGVYLTLKEFAEVVNVHRKAVMNRAIAMHREPPTWSEPINAPD